MNRLVLVTLLATGLLGALASGTSRAADAACIGYATPRVDMEAQSSFDPQPGPPTHPGTGKLGDIHVETCFPLYQHFGATGSIPFDVTVSLHNFTGIVKDLRLNAYGDYVVQVANNIDWRCPGTECERQFHAELPLAQLKYSGVHAVQIELYVTNEDGKNQYTLPRWPIYFDNGKPAPPTGSQADALVQMIHQRGVITDSYNLHDNSEGEKHAGPLAIAGADYPWDPATGQMKVQTGLWQPRLYFEGDTAFAYLDADLHANPPVQRVVYDGPGYTWGPRGFNNLHIDTRTLSDGPHQLLIGSCVEYATGTHCGANNIRFTVGNGTGSDAGAGLADTTKPVISRLRLSAKHFRAAGRGPSAKTARVGARLSYRLSEAAGVKFQIQRAVSGRRSHGRCVAPKHAKRRAKHCTHWMTLRGSFSHKSAAGVTRLIFRGRLRGHRLRPDRYRLVAGAIDAAGNMSAPAQVRYRIVRR